MALIKGKCPITGELGTLIKSNNPIAAPVSIKQIESALDLKNLEHADFFCRTYNLPFNPTQWIKSIQKDKGKRIIENYYEFYLDLNPELKYETATKDIWREANKEWQRSLTHGELLEKIKPIKEDFITRSRMVWGTMFTFEELIKMESQYQTTISSFDINNPMQLDAIRKACITSVMIDKVMTGNGDVKSLKDLSAAYASFMKMAKIDELIESSQTEVLRTVADLANHLETEGFEFKFYDNVERDIVDKTINNLKDYTRTLVLESTGLEATLELISSKYQEGLKEGAAKEAFEGLSLEEVTRIAKEEVNDEIDEALAAESILDVRESDEEDELGGFYDDEEDF